MTSRGLSTLLLMAMTSACGPQISDKASLLEALEQERGWLMSLGQCPADVAPLADLDVEYLGDFCMSRLGTCFRRCKGGDSNGCYALALASRELELPKRFGEALYYEACRLGQPPGCTNRAAGMLLEDPLEDGDLACIVDTFDKMCALDDPWACTMAGGLLVQGTRVPRDLPRALGMLSKSCRYGDEDPACAGAKQLIELASKLQSQPPGSDGRE